MDISSAEKALVEGNVDELCKQLTTQFPRDPNLDEAQALVRYALGNPVPLPRATGRDQVFLESIAETKRLLRGAPSRGLNHGFAGREMDFLCDREGIEGWGLLQCLNFLLLGRLQPRRRSAVVSSMRDDGIYILEWVAHYQVLGFDRIIIYTNDNADGSEELLRLLAAHNIITLIESEISEDVPPDAKAFGHAIHLLHELRDFEWALFVDSDEYFMPGPQFNYCVSRVLAAVQQQFPEQPPAGICYDWLWFVSGMAFARIPRLLVERFQHARPHHMSKCMARTQNLISMRRDHYPEVKPGGMIVDSVFDPVDMNSIYRRTPQYAGGRINHYWARSFEEFAIKKARGASLKLEINLYDRPFPKFFAWNGFETPQNHYPADPILLGKVKQQIGVLEKLEGVRSVADKLNIGFPDFVKSIDHSGSLRKIYEESKIAPTDL